MGQCVSSKSDPKHPDYTHKYIQPPTNEKSQTLRFSKFDQNSKADSSYGSENEAFYDTQPWLDSDCEEHYYSVNGDITPSRGSNPIHVSFASPEIRRSPYWHKNNSVLASLTTVPGQSPRKKSLSDLFEESGRYITEQGMLAANGTEEFPYVSAVSSPCTFGARSSYSNQNTPDVNATVRKVSSLKSVK